MTFTGLITIATSAWATATIVVMLLRHMREGRRARLGDLGCGLRFWPWIVLVALLDTVIAETMNLTVNFAEPFPLFSAIGMAAYALTNLVVALFLGATIFAFSTQAVTDAHCNALTALGASWRLVFRVGFWRVLGNRLLFALCLAPLVLAASALNAERFTSWSAVAGPVAGQTLNGVVVAPLLAAFATVMYLLAYGDRARLEAVLGPVSGGRGSAGSFTDAAGVLLNDVNRPPVASFTSTGREASGAAAEDSRMTDA